MEDYEINAYQIENGVFIRYTGREEVVQVPEGIHTIGEGAFKGCVSLRKMVLPQGLSCIMGDAFKGCRKLEEVVIPEGVSYIGRYAFHRCHALKKAILPPSVEELGEFAFLYCDSLKEVWIPGVKRLGMEAFANGMSLEKLVISRELDTRCICDVFTGCGRVTEISYSDGTNVETFCIPNVVEVTAGEFTVPPLIKLVADDIVLRMMELEGRILVRFRINIKHVEVPEGIEVLAKSSFFDMRGILSIRLPKSLKRIESHAFRNCIGLEQVTFGGSE
ncbi:MAG: leucine-rich repeat domain-containing protein, partial [Lachnospiraceae bacterium]|nr:leucine-rich repeat domain-containing protein [Lachnospiraceae bacterium]